MRFRTFAFAAGLLVASLGPAAAGGEQPAGYRPLVLEGFQLKWGKPVLGAGAYVTYAVVDGERHFGGARNCSSLGPMDTVLASNGIAASLFEAELSKAFEAWQSIAGVTFVPGDPATANILIGRQLRPRGRAFTNVSYNEKMKTVGVRSLTQALICINPTKRWKVGFDGDLDVYDLRYTLMHEIGHAIGLNHPEVRSSLMHFSYREEFRALQDGDKAGAIALYGAAFDATRVADSADARDPGDAKSWGEAAFDEEGVPRR